MVSTNPVPGAIGAPLRSAIIVDFSEALAPANVSSASVSLRRDGAPVSGAVTYSGRTAMFRPEAPLSGSTVYTATLTTSIMDPSGIALAADLSWSFTTGSPSPVPPLSQAVAYQVDYGRTGFVELGAPLALPSAPTWSVTLPGAASYPLIVGNRVFVTTGRRGALMAVMARYKFACIVRKSFGVTPNRRSNASLKRAGGERPT